MTKKTATNNDNDNAHDGEEWRAICERNKELEHLLEVYECRIQTIKQDMDKWGKDVTTQYTHLKKEAHALEDKLYKKNATIYHLSEQLIDSSNFGLERGSYDAWHQPQCDYVSGMWKITPRPDIDDHYI